MSSMVTPQHAEELSTGARALGIELTPVQHEQLLAYLALLIKWNKAYNLTAVRNPDEMVSRHLLDSLSVIPFIDSDAENERWLDVGSGGGMPGIPMAIMFPQMNVSLLDSNGKKTRFQTQVKLELKLDNLEVIHSRAETYQPDVPFNGIISRAFSSLEDFAGWTRHMGDTQTRWLAMKGLHPADELVALPTDFHLDSAQALTVPGCQGQRHLLILRRTA
ncbi:16S rRNA (guanine(527)-N(7))-methyltransferase RsmG [Pseudomonas alliivorans]|uniref:Ribosomal RNA small subunit methyltransferase G n=1 Tax=Pseudomonas alliivorans TaxID=2810613 RepID=A0ABS4C4L2_9PSED|nr:16S rRNA (guanine(527)-N(7))-methyltransferase RsmG [Pseudomonas alliivorans]MBP0945515.1 16S rRNA (guanine(527)-N(7))-methyltransferase RsmG [Pseudomonas alliivorans]MBP0950765.1 16S rRNA (guanine(527)-N(7))-methyltransferase RsmG [Pseudomonas alliivorans]MCO5367651.1 16S rRNA (guanine(527)-N(7))-methyltransferase RsmG [Pseudomonas alliivorans]MEE4326037.1 16S rRNA (guanine(527)-N(7))-methyltransferase RsmG [Pseudomonas alliivorans]MEE4334071.1 16S rRNA (guanine(527)-N(7))-methyltransferas